MPAWSEPLKAITELITLFLTKVKEGCLFDFDNITQEIGVTLLSKEYLPYFLENTKKTNPKYFIQLYVFLSGQLSIMSMDS